jgi:hypothetical protein
MHETAVTSIHIYYLYYHLRFHFCFANTARPDSLLTAMLVRQLAFSKQLYPLLDSSLFFIRLPVKGFS